MAKVGAIQQMIDYVQEYIDGERSRLDFDLDFNHYFTKNYPKMKHENRELADCLDFYISEEGIDRADGLSDAQHKKLIKKQFKEFKSAMNDGLY